MPNHFHLMIYVHEVSETIGGATPSRTPNNNDLNKSIGILLASYTRAINKQENTTGSLFRDKTKAECLTKFQGITPSFYGNQINVRIPEKEYPIVCWNYIHNNPVTANMVDRAEDFVYSSYRDFTGLRDGKLINKNRAKEFGLI